MGAFTSPHQCNSTVDIVKHSNKYLLPERLAGEIGQQRVLVSGLRGVALGTMGGWVNQAYSRLSTTHGHITDCKLDSVVYAGVCVVILMWICLVWAKRSTTDNLNFRAPSHRFNSATGEQKGITQTIYIDSRPVGCLTH